MDGAWRLSNGSLALAIGLGVALVLVVILEASLEASGRRRVARMFVRGAILASLALTIAAPVARREEPAPKRLVAVLDRASEAEPAGRSIATRILDEAAAAAKRDGSELVVVRYGVETNTSGLQPDVFPVEGPTSLAAALAAARMSIDADAAGAVVAVDDGRGDLRGARDAAKGLSDAEIPLRAVVAPPETPRAKAPTIDALRVPEVARGPFVVRVAVSGLDGLRMAQLLVDGIPFESVALPKAAGPAQEATFAALSLPPGVHEIGVAVAEVAEAAPAGDARPTHAPVVLKRALVRVTTPPKILVVSDAGEASAARRALVAQEMDAAVLRGADLSAALAAPTRPDVVVLDADAAISDVAAAALVDRVRAGTGLLLLAGRSADAWAAVGRGPLASVLPLLPAPPPAAPPPPPPPPPEDPPEPPPPPPDRPPDPGPGLSMEKRPEEAFPISLLLVIDRSGSMAGEPLRLAIVAAELAASTLAPTDRVGVVTFADDPTLDLPLRPAGEVAAGGLVSVPRADGNTDILRAIAAAERVMRDEKNPIRHVILLTDGRPSRPAFYADIVGRMREEAITMTMVGLGHDVDLGLLNRLAALAGGRLLLAPSPSEVPRVFTRDTKRILDARTDTATKAPRVDDPAKTPPKEPPKPPPPKPEPPKPPPAKTPPKDPTPRPPPPVAAARLRRVRAHEALVGLEDAVLPAVAPPLGASVAKGASLLLEREDARPALGASRAGLGRVLAWAPPADDLRVLDWALWPRLLAQSVRSLLPPTEATPVPTVRVTHETRGDVLRVTLPEGDASAGSLSVTKDGSGPLEGVAKPLGVEDGEVLFLLPPAAPNETVAVARVALTGASEGPAAAIPPVAYLPRGGEPPATGGDPAALSAALGVALSAPDAPDLFAVPARARPVDRPLFAWCLVLALLLLPLDVALHRRPASARPAGSVRA